MSQLCYLYNLSKDTKEQSYRAGLSLSGFDLQKQFAQCKKEIGFEWLNEAPSQTQQAIIDRLDNAYKKFYKDHKNGTIQKLKSEYLINCTKNNVDVNWGKYNSIGRPKWAKRSKWKSIPFKSIKQIHNGFFKLPKIGVVKVFSPNVIEGKLKTAQIIKEADGYYLNVQVEIGEIYRESKGDLAIDRGLKYLAVTSDGEYIDNPKINEKTEKKLRVLNRKLSRTKEGSNNRRKVINNLQRVYLKRKRQRRDFLHKLTTDLANKYETIYLEDLKTSKMVKDKKYSKGISDVGWYMFEELLSYKTNVIKVDPAYTSQTCSNCGHVDKESRKIQSVFKCTSCNFQENADYQACLNILKRGRADLNNAKVDR